MKDDVNCIKKNDYCRFQEHEDKRLKQLIQCLDSAKILWNQVLKLEASDHVKALGSKILDKVEMISGAAESLAEELERRWKTGTELWPLFCDINDLIDGTLQLIESYKLPLICDDVLDLTDAEPGVGVSNIHVRFRDAEIARLHNSARRNRIHRASSDGRRT